MPREVTTSSIARFGLSHFLVPSAIKMLDESLARNEQIGRAVAINLAEAFPGSIPTRAFAQV